MQKYYFYTGSYSYVKNTEVLLKPLSGVIGVKTDTTPVEVYNMISREWSEKLTKELEINSDDLTIHYYNLELIS